MRSIADLHTHSRFARAVSKEIDIPALEAWGAKKGIELIGTGDFTHPSWFAELKKELEEDGKGLLVRRGSTSPIRFVFSAEIACIFSRSGAVRRIHVLVVLPTFTAVETINARLGWIGNLRADGRPMLGLDIKELVKIAKDASPDALIIPAHVWTPWFGMYGSKSGFDSFADCFEDLAHLVPAVETGLSSDPVMNWRMEELDTKSIVSFSDAHSLHNLGREATVFNLEAPTFNNVAAALAVPFPTKQDGNRITMTIEFFPEEGIYHWDGHRACNIRWSPEETKKAGGICPVCKKKVTVGVMNRVEELADRAADFQDKRRPLFRRLVQLDKIIADALGVGRLTKTVEKEYNSLVAQAGTEIKALLDLAPDELLGMTTPKIADGIQRVREGRLRIVPGYDGVYGTINVFSKDEQAKPVGQGSLF